MNIAFVPVRSGSKSIPLKNIKNFCNKPLIYWCLEALQKCSLVDIILLLLIVKKLTQLLIILIFQKLIYTKEIPRMPKIHRAPICHVRIFV